MDALEYLNKVLGEIDYGIKGTKQEWKEIYDDNFGINRYNNLSPYQRIEQEINSATIGDETPKWISSVAQRRGSSEYQTGLQNQKYFTLGGKTYRWEEADNPQYVGHWKNSNSNSGIAEEMARNSHANPEQYQGSYLNLINERERLTGKRYIPVRIN